MIMAGLALFQSWIRVGVGIGKFLIDLGVRNIFDIKLCGVGACWCLDGCMFRCITMTQRSFFCIVVECLKTYA